MLSDPERRKLYDETGKHAARQASRQAGRPAGRQAGRQLPLPFPTLPYPAPSSARVSYRLGITDAESEKFFSAFTFFRRKKITIEDIEKYYKEYRGGSEEDKDLIDFYKK